MSYFTKKQLEQEIKIEVTVDQRKIINESLDFYIDCFGSQFQSVNALMIRHYPNTLNMHTFSFCSRLLRILEKVYFSDIKFQDIALCKYHSKAHNLREDIKFSKKNFECRVEDALFLANTVIETYQRILMGQLNHIDEQMRLYLYWDQIKKHYNPDLIRIIINDLCYYYFNMSNNASYGITSKELCPASKKAYMILRWIENDIYGHFKVKGSGNNYFNEPPLNVIKHKRIKVVFDSYEEINERK